MRISGIANTAETPTTGDYIAIDGSANGTRKFALFAWLISHFVGKSDVMDIAHGGTNADNASDAVDNLGAAKLYGGKVLPNQASSAIVLIQEDTTIAPAHSGKCLKCLSASDITLTVPVSTGFDPGTEIEIVRYGAGGVTITPGTGATICVTGDASQIQYRYKAAVLKLMDTNEWLLNGDLV